jgi:TRAP transporter TAXI family solute receptor
LTSSLRAVLAALLTVGGAWGGAALLVPAGGTVVVFAGGGLGGSTYGTLTGFAYIIRKHTGLDVRVIPAGGLISLVKVGTGEVQGAIGNSPFLHFAQEGRPPFDRTFPDLRAVMQGGGGLNLAHFVVADEVPVRSIAELATRRYPLRLAVDRKGTTDNWILGMVLRHHGITTDDIRAWGGSVREMGYAEQARLLTDGHIDAVFQNSPIPSSSLIEISHARPIRILPLPETLVDEMTREGWVRQQIPRKAYERALGEGPVATVGYTMPFIVNAAVPDDLVHAITRALCENPQETRSVHRSWRQFDPETAWRDTGLALHPGAARYFREKGHPVADPPQEAP